MMSEADYNGDYAPLCPRCNQRPRNRQPSGRLDGYCTVCRNKYQREREKEKYQSTKAAAEAEKDETIAAQQYWNEKLARENERLRDLLIKYGIDPESE